MARTSLSPNGPAAERLSAEDDRILKLERGPIAGHGCSVIVVDEPADGEAFTLPLLRSHVASRLGLVPRCRQRLAPTPLRVAPPLWVDDDRFDIDHHVSELAGGRTVGEDTLRREVARLMEGRLDRRHPLWSLHMARLSDGRTALVWREHHCMADGMTGLRVLSGLLWDTQAEPDPVEPSSHQPTPLYSDRELFRLGLAACLRPAGRDDSQRGPLDWRKVPEAATGLAAFLRREVLPSSAPSPLAARVGSGRVVGWTSAPLDQLHAAGKAVGHDVKVNDVVLGVVAGGVRKWLSNRRANTDHIRVKVPVSLHQRGEAVEELGNRDSFILVELHVDEPDLSKRLIAISQETSERKQAHDAEELDALLGELRHLPLGEHAEDLTMSPRVFALNVSNVPGPPGPLYVMGGRVVALHGVTEIGQEHALRAGARSAVGLLSFGLCADAAVVPDIDVIIEGMQNAIDELLVLASR